MAKVIITGASGFIGSHLAKRLLRRGDEVVGIDSLTGAGTQLKLLTLASAKYF